MENKKALPPHWTCLDTSVAGQQPYTTWVCGPQCPKPESKSPGQAAFETWQTMFNSMPGNIWPFTATWDALSDETRQVWQTIADAAYGAHIGEPCVKHTEVCPACKVCRACERDTSD